MARPSVDLAVVSFQSSRRSRPPAIPPSHRSDSVMRPPGSPWAAILSTILLSLGLLALPGPAEAQAPPPGQGDFRVQNYATGTGNGNFVFRGYLFRPSRDVVVTGMWGGAGPNCADQGFGGAIYEATLTGTPGTANPAFNIGSIAGGGVAQVGWTLFQPNTPEYREFSSPVTLNAGQYYAIAQGRGGASGSTSGSGCHFNTDDLDFENLLVGSAIISEWYPQMNAQYNIGGTGDPTSIQGRTSISGTDNIRILVGFRYETAVVEPDLSQVATGAFQVSGSNNVVLEGVLQDSGAGGPDDELTLYFEYATNPGFTGATLQPAEPFRVRGPATDLPFGVTLPNLSGGTTYYYRAVAINEAGRANGSVESFTVGSMPQGFEVQAQVSGGGGSVTPATRVVESGNTTTFVVQPDGGFLVDGVTGCSGTLSGNTYTTGSITSSCSVTVTFRTLSTNADLSALTPSEGSLSPSFSAGTLAYTVSVPSTTESLTLTPVTAESSSTITVDGVGVTSGSPSPAIALAPGETTIPVVVTAEVSTNTNTYTVTVTRRQMPTVTVDEPPSFTYTGSPQGPDQASNTGTGSSYTFFYEGVGDTSYELANDPPTRAGSYRVQATVAASSDGAWDMATSEWEAFSIAPRPITVTAGPADKAAGTDDPPLTFDITEGSLVEPDELSGGLTRESGETPGTYAILQGSLANPDYAITYVGADFTIEPGPVDESTSTVQAAPVEVSADGEAASTITVTVRDGPGNPVPGQTVRIEADGGSSVISTGSNDAVSDAEGQVTFVVRSSNPVGEQVTYRGFIGTGSGEVQVASTATVNFRDVTAATITGPTQVVVEEGNQVVAQYAASEPVTWALAAVEGRASDLDPLRIDPQSGAVSFRAPAQSGVYQVRVQAIDGGGNTSGRTVEVTVPGRPRLSSTPAGITPVEPGRATLSLEVQEGTSLVTRLQADRSVSWVLVGGPDADRFQLDPHGTLRFVAPLPPVGASLDVVVEARAGATLDVTAVEIAVSVVGAPDPTQGGCAPTELEHGAGVFTRGCEAGGGTIAPSGDGVTGLIPPDVRMSVRALGSDGAPRPPVAGRLHLAEGGSVRVDGAGLLPSTVVQVAIFPASPELLGSTPVTSTGTFDAAFPIPPGLEPGSYTLVVTGTDASGVTVTLSLGVFLDGTGPSAPQNLSGTSADRTIRLTWAPPLFSGGGPIMGYQVQLRTGASGDWIAVASDLSRDSRGFTLDQLTNNRAYQVRVRAENQWGFGPWAQGGETFVPVAPLPMGDGATPEPDPGEVVTRRNGQPDSVVVEVVRRNTVQVREAGSESFRLSVTALNQQGEPIAVSETDPVVEVDQVGSIQSGGDGFEPGSAATVYIFSPDGPILLGALMVGADGSFSGSYPLPAGISIGRHTLQVNGLDAGGNERSIALGIRVSPSTPEREADDVPEAPGNLDAVALEDGAILTWGSSPPSAGGEITRYIVEVWNLETSELRQVEVEVVLPLTLRVEDLAAGEAVRFRVAAVNDAGRGPFTSWTPSIVPGPPELSVEMAVSEGEAVVGDSVDVLITVTNLGQVMAEGIWLTRGLNEPGLELEDWDASQGEIEEDEDGLRYWRVGSLAPNQSATLTIRVRVQEPHNEEMDR